MSRPWWLNVSPPALRTKIYYALHRARAAEQKQRYASAPLAFAPTRRMQLWPGDEAHGEIAFTGFYELELTKRVVALGRRGGLMIDVGANFGYFTLLWAAANPANRVKALEPSPRNLEALQHNVTTNGFKSRVESRALAASRSSGHAQFSAGPEDQTGWGGLGHGAGQVIEVKTVTLDQLCAEIYRVDLLKIDTEGADAWVLQGATELLRRRAIRHIYFGQNLSRWRELGIDPQEASKLLRENGYEVKPLRSATEFYATPRRTMR